MNSLFFLSLSKSVFIIFVVIDQEILVFLKSTACSYHLPNSPLAQSWLLHHKEFPRVSSLDYSSKRREQNQEKLNERATLLRLSTNTRQNREIQMQFAVWPKVLIGWCVTKSKQIGLVEILLGDKLLGQ